MVCTRDNTSSFQRRGQRTNRLSRARLGSVLAALAAAVIPVSAAKAQVWNEVGDAGFMPGTAQFVAGSGPLTEIWGSVGFSGDVDIYRIRIDSTFQAIEQGAIGNPAGIYTARMFLFDLNGVGIRPGTHGSTSTEIGPFLFGPLVLPPGEYLLAIGSLGLIPHSAGGAMWEYQSGNAYNYQGEGPGIGQPLVSWGAASGTGSYRIELQGASFIGTGACCLAGYTCVATTALDCQTQSGTYLGDNTECSACPQPPTGACCLAESVCMVITQAACETAFGVYRGDGTDCTISCTDCVRKQGFWKNNPHAWPMQDLDLGAHTYSQAELLAMLNQPTRRNGLVILTRQLIAAELNLAAGASADAGTLAAIGMAHSMIGSLVPAPVGPGFLQPRQTDALATFLEFYNSGQTATLPCE